MGDSVESFTGVQGRWFSCVVGGMTLIITSLSGEDSAVPLMEKSCEATSPFAPQQKASSHLRDASQGHLWGGRECPDNPLQKNISV